MTPETLPYIAKLTSDLILKLELNKCHMINGHRLFDDRKWSIKESKKGGYL